MFIKKLTLLSIILTGTFLAACSSPQNYKPGVSNGSSSLLCTEFDAGSKEQRKLIAEKMWTNPGDFNPAELVRAAAYFNFIKDYEKGTRLLTGALLRARIDVEASKDPSLSDVPAILQMLHRDLSQDSNTNPSECLQNGLPYYLKSMEGVLVWDGKTPRNYNLHWVNAHSINNFLPQSEQKRISTEDYQKVIKKIHYKYIEEYKKEGIKITPYFN